MKTIGTLLMIFFFGTTVNAQGILKSIGNTAKNKVEQQDFNTTRTNKDKSNIQNEKKEAPASSPAPPPTEPSTSTPETDYSNMDSATAVQMANNTHSTTDLIYKESYTFNGKVTYQMEDLKKAKKNSITYHYAPDAICTEMVDMKSCSIMDYTNEVMITFDEASKSATVMSASFMNKATAQAADNHEEKVGGSTIKKTGLTKKIIGYNCDNYIQSRYSVVDNKLVIIPTDSNQDLNNNKIPDFEAIKPSFIINKDGTLIRK